MKITRRQLKRIIHEELEQVLQEQYRFLQATTAPTPGVDPIEPLRGHGRGGHTSTLGTEEDFFGLGPGGITGQRPVATRANLVQQAAVVGTGAAASRLPAAVRRAGATPVRVPRWARQPPGERLVRDANLARAGYPAIPARDVLRHFVGPEVARRASQAAGRISRPFVREPWSAHPGLTPLGAMAITGAERFRDFRDALSRFGDTRQQERTPPTRVSQESPATRPQTSASRPPPIAMGTADTQDYMRTQRRIGSESGGGQTAW